MIYFQLFLSFFQIGLLSFGGGYAAMPLIQPCRIHGRDRHIPDDAGADRSQFGNLRRN